MTYYPNPVGQIPTLLSFGANQENVWRRVRKRKSVKGECQIRTGDFLIGRVGRRCIAKFGRASHLKGEDASDCIFILRPRSKLNSQERAILYGAIKTALVENEKIILRGVGANYVTKLDLENLELDLLNELTLVNSGDRSDVAR